MSSRSTEGRLLLVSAVVAVAVAFAAFVSDEVTAGVVGWFFGGPVATTLVAMYRSATTRWTAQTGRVPLRWHVLLSIFVVVVGFAFSIVHASTVAWELS